MASASLCCPISRGVGLVPSGSSKAAASARPSLHFGRRGRAVQKPRLMQLGTTQAMARQLQALHIGLVAVF